MERQEKVVLTLDPYEHGIMIRALNELRNDLLEDNPLWATAMNFSILEGMKRPPIS